MKKPTLKVNPSILSFWELQYRTVIFEKASVWELLRIRRFVRISIEFLYIGNTDDEIDRSLNSSVIVPMYYVDQIEC